MLILASMNFGLVTIFLIAYEEIYESNEQSRLIHTLHIREILWIDAYWIEVMNYIIFCLI